MSQIEAVDQIIAVYRGFILNMRFKTQEITNILSDCGSTLDQILALKNGEITMLQAEVEKLKADVKSLKELEPSTEDSQEE